MWRCASSGCRSTSIPLTMTRPAVGTANPQIIFNVVVFPAPFGPTSPKISPVGTSRFKRSAATTCQSLLDAASYSLDKFSRWTIGTGILFSGRHCVNQVSAACLQGAKEGPLAEAYCWPWRARSFGLLIIYKVEGMSFSLGFHTLETSQQWFGRVLRRGCSCGTLYFGAVDAPSAGGYVEL